MKKYCFMWVDSGLSTKPSKVNIPYRFVHLPEISDYVTREIDGKVDILDFELEKIGFDKVIEKVIEQKYSAVAFYITNENLSNSIKINYYIKEIIPNCKTIAYGDFPLYLPNFFLKTNFDAIVDKHCDQEVAILDFFKFSDNEIESKEMRGVLSIKDNIFIKNKKGIYLPPSEWGLPNTSLIPAEKYFETQNKRQITITISRGCPYNCPYCNAVSYYGLKERRRPIADIINYINSKDYTYYKFFAPNFTLNKSEVIKLCDSLINNKKKIKWSCTTRPDLLVDEGLIKKMAEAGCYKIAVGIESIIVEDLEKINKRYDFQNLNLAIGLLNKYNIELKALVMFGMKGQNKDNILKTLDYLSEKKLVIRPTAYTPFYKMNEMMSLEEISKFDKRTYYEGIEGLNYGQFLRLIYDVKNYKNILDRE